MLGSAFMQTLYKIESVTGISLARKDADIICNVANQGEFVEALNGIQPSIIINCAAIVDLNVCETSPTHSWNVNVEPLFTLSKWLQGRSCKLIQISTDHFYDYGADSAHSETDPLVFTNIYAKHKFIAEKIALEIQNALVLRTSIIGRSYYKGSKQGFWEWAKDVVTYDKPATLFTDSYSSSIDIGSFCEATLHLIEKDISGLMNLASSQIYSKSEFIIELSDQLKKELSQAKNGSVNSLQVKRASCLGLDVSLAEKTLNVQLPSMSDVITRLLLSDMGS